MVVVAFEPDGVDDHRHVRGHERHVRRARAIGVDGLDTAETQILARAVLKQAV